MTNKSLTKKAIHAFNAKTECTSLFMLVLVMITHILYLMTTFCVASKFLAPHPQNGLSILLIGKVALNFAQKLYCPLEDEKSYLHIYHLIIINNKFHVQQSQAQIEINLMIT